MSLLLFREQEAKIKGEYSDLKGKAPKDIRRLKMMKRIQQYERFVENCERYKEFEKSKRDKELVVRRNSMVDGLNQRSIEKMMKRSKSFPHDREYKESKQKDRYSLPELPECDQNFTLDEKILIWQCCGEPQQKKGWMKSLSLTVLVEETEEKDIISVNSKRRSKSIDSCVTCTYG